MLRVLSLIILAAISASAFSDEPLRPPEEKRVCDLWINYCAYLHPKRNAVLYKIDGAFNKKELYEVPGWHRSVFISFDGKYFISGYDGLNLVPLNVTEDEVMITIYKNGIEHKKITLGQMVRDLKKLKKTTSHYEWGSIEAVNDKLMYIDTVDGKAVVDLDTGEVEHY
ncbi:hypothetical protein [Microbulbifer yueqingensis]|uniref:hypothetical protein n=1 Tax=Microbulbifer yueqingensis TaxID=658219 RepID=UPI0011132FBD|nr:hypothetical protein [Microbulbifer yueqingensis]